MEKIMISDISFFLPIGLFLGYAAKGMFITKIDFFEEEAIFMLIPFLFAFIPNMFILSGLNAYHQNILLAVLMSWFLAFGFCVGLMLCNRRQRTLGLV